MAQAKKKKNTGAMRAKRERDELETLRAEYRTLIGRAIIAGLVKPRASGLGGIGSDLLLAAPDYNQDTGDYIQSGGGDHQQNSGNYTQSP